MIRSTRACVAGGKSIPPRPPPPIRPPLLPAIIPSGLPGAFVPRPPASLATVFVVPALVGLAATARSGARSTSPVITDILPPAIAVTFVEAVPASNTGLFVDWPPFESASATLEFVATKPPERFVVAGVTSAMGFGLGAAKIFCGAPFDSAAALVSECAIGFVPAAALVLAVPARPIADALVESEITASEFERTPAVLFVPWLTASGGEFVGFTPPASSAKDGKAGILAPVRDKARNPACAISANTNAASKRQTARRMVSARLRMGAFHCSKSSTITVIFNLICPGRDASGVNLQRFND